MSVPTPVVSPELKVLLRKLKLGKLIDTLPETGRSVARSES